MFSNKDVATNVEKTMRQCSEVLNESIRDVMETCSDEEFGSYRQVIARIMGSIYLDVMQPIYRKYPDLESEDFRTGN